MIPTVNIRVARLILGFFVAIYSAVAADVTGIWAGQQLGRRGETEDVAFRLKLDGQTLAGTLFGDELDIPIGEGSLTGDQIRFTVTITNYYSGTKSKFIYTGSVKGNEMELVRERVPTPEDATAKRPIVKQTLRLKRLG
jgi:hypothetical protein